MLSVGRLQRVTLLKYIEYLMLAWWSVWDPPGVLFHNIPKQTFLELTMNSRGITRSVAESCLNWPLQYFLSNMSDFQATLGDLENPFTKWILVEVWVFFSLQKLGKAISWSPEMVIDGFHPDLHLVLETLPNTEIKPESEIVALGTWCSGTWQCYVYS